MPNTFTEGTYPSDVVKMEAANRFSRDTGTIGTGADLEIGTVLGYNPAGSMTVAAAVAAGGNTGDGNVTLANPAFGPDVVPGAYTLRCVAAATNAGTFDMVDPNGDVVETLTVAVAAEGSHLKLTINDGATDFAVGDSFTIAVTKTAEGEYYQLDPDAITGIEVAAAILLTPAAAASADVADAVLLKRHAEVNKRALVWPDGITDGQKANALAELAALGIIAREGA